MTGSSLPGMFAGFFRGDYDVSEFSLADLVYYISRGHDDFCGIPVFPSRVFRHGFIAARRAVVERHPDLPAKLFNLFSKAKRWGQEWVRMDPSLGLAWKNHYLDEEREIFEGDPWTYGLKENTRLISQFLTYCYDLGVSERALRPKDLFYPSTWDLTEEP